MWSNAETMIPQSIPWYSFGTIIVCGRQVFQNCPDFKATQKKGQVVNFSIAIDSCE